MHDWLAVVISTWSDWVVLLAQRMCGYYSHEENIEFYLILLYIHGESDIGEITLLLISISVKFKFQNVIKIIKLSVL